MFVFSIAKLQQRAGVTRINAKLVPETKLVANGYREQEISDYRTFTYYVLNDTMINQISLLGANIKEVHALQFPPSIPVPNLITTQSVANIAKHRKGDGMGYQNDHLKRLGGHATFKVLEGSHFIYQTKAREIAEITTEFVESI